MTLTDYNSQVANSNLSRAYPFKCGTSLALQSRARSNALCLAFFSSSRSRWQSPELPSPTSRVQYFPVSLLSSLTDWNSEAKALHIYTLLMVRSGGWSCTKLAVKLPGDTSLPATGKSWISRIKYQRISKILHTNFSINNMYPKTVLLARHRGCRFTLFFIVHHDSAGKAPHEGQTPPMALCGLGGAGR